MDYLEHEVSPLAEMRSFNIGTIKFGDFFFSNTMY